MDDTSHASMAPLNALASSNISRMFVTHETSHSPMGPPYVASAASASSRYASTASPRLYVPQAGASPPSLSPPPLPSQQPCVTPHEVAEHAEPSNARSVLTEVPTHHPRFWSKSSALLNIPFMFVTDDTSHASMAALNAWGLRNINHMAVTDDTSHAPMAALY